ncbi:hypothetical protein A584_05967 [Pseudomonas syringae pv. theae ICMP 3923]|nr:hypothetical protein [Pseudomonas syringae]EPM72249.1 hypothetical protein A584_05967 [Pseudomonas syringae pv. theae ICMP 3923]KPZ34271.1 hypothetical protein AN901_203978 [Pseudomonas syringae pv. theae]MBL3830150.1 hypothetical protein [Pseudomonas syringae pv. theae]MBL3838377.1 hypothetical protein [Pseudomonas syringae pv. theae]MBL3868501.1 hypothetical protein [Pseudomonas syringae pv. theae]
MYSPKEESARQTRKNWLAKRQAHLDQEDPRMPVLEALGILGPIIGDDRNLWPVSEWNNPLVVSVPASAPVEMGVGDTITFFLDDVELDTILLNTAEDLRYSIAANLINSGKPYEVWYQHSSWLGNTMPSISLVLDVDYQAPNRNQTGAPAVLPDEVVSDGLTLEYLDNHGSLDITVPRSSDILAGDTVTISWVPVVARSFRQDFSPIVSKVISVEEAEPGAADPLVSIDSELIKGLVPGKIGIYYRYIDRTGNMGQFSPATVLQVDLTPAPDNLQAPRVFLAEGDGIDRADAQLGVEVEIPEPIYDNPQPDDQIQVIWEGTPVPAVTLDTLPMYIPIDWPTLSANGPLDKRGFKVSYNVVRGALSTPSPDLDVTVDFTVAGPAPDPLTPGPINAALPAIVVKSREVPPLDNVLGNADKDKDATAELASNPFAIGDTLRLYWGDLRPHFAELIIAATGTAIQFVIPWDVIKRGGYNDRLPVYYSTWNGVNEQESEHIEVDVRIVDITGLPEVGFPDRFVPPAGPTPVPIINCCSLPWNGIKIHIPFDPTNMDAGDEVIIKWQAYEDRVGTSPIDSTYHEFDPIKLVEGNLYVGIPFVIPYAGLVEPVITVGSGRVTYTLKKANGQRGEHSTLTIITRMAGTGLCSESFPGVCNAFVGDGSDSTI